MESAAQAAAPVADEPSLWLEPSARMLTRDEPSQLVRWVAVGGEASRFVVVHASRSDWESAQRQVRSIRTQFFFSAGALSSLLACTVTAGAGARAARTEPCQRLPRLRSGGGRRAPLSNYRREAGWLPPLRRREGEVRAWAKLFRRQ
jgi:hypothetical protein